MQLINIPSHSLTMLNKTNTEFTDQNSRPLKIH